MIPYSVPRPDPIFMSKTLIEEVSESEEKFLKHNCKNLSVSPRGPMVIYLVTLQWENENSQTLRDKKYNT